MKLQRSTVILIFLALALGSFVYIWETQVAPKQEQSRSSAKRPIFSFSKDQVQSITLKTTQYTLVLDRAQPEDAQKPGGSPWLMTVTEQRSRPESSPSPTPAATPSPSPSPTPSPSPSPTPPPIPTGTTQPANEAYVAYLMDLLVNGTSDRAIATPADQLANFGLQEPNATIDIKLNNQQTHQLILGNPDFNRAFLYAQTDPAAPQNTPVEVLLVSTDFDNAVNRPLSDWPQPPAEVAPTTPTPTATPSPAATESPAATTPTATPSPAATESPAATPSPAATESPAATPSPAATESPAATPSPAATESPAATTPTPSPTATPSPTN